MTPLRQRITEANGALRDMVCRGLLLMLESRLRLRTHHQSTLFTPATFTHPVMNPC